MIDRTGCGPLPDSGMDATIATTDGGDPFEELSCDDEVSAPDPVLNFQEALRECSPRPLGQMETSLDVTEECGKALVNHDYGTFSMIGSSLPVSSNRFGRLGFFGDEKRFVDVIVTNIPSTATQDAISYGGRPHYVSLETHAIAADGKRSSTASDTVAYVMSFGGENEYSDGFLLVGGNREIIELLHRTVALAMVEHKARPIIENLVVRNARVLGISAKYFCD